MCLDEALRSILCEFTLPGEPQQINRITEIFSSKYFSDNKDGDSQLYKNVENLNTMSYFLIFLHTTMYNPSITQKINLQDFVKITAGVQEFPFDYVSKLYISILNKPLATHELDRYKKYNNGNDNGSQRSVFLKKEFELIFKNIRNFFDLGLNWRDSNFIYWSFTFNSLFMDFLWSPLIATFSVIYQNDLSFDASYKCIIGVYKTTKVLSYFNLADPRDTAISTLIFFSNISNFSRF